MQSDPVKRKLDKLEARHNALVEAVNTASKQIKMIRRELSKTLGDVNISLLMGDLAEVDRLLSEADNGQK